MKPASKRRRRKRWAHLRPCQKPASVLISPCTVSLHLTTLILCILLACLAQDCGLQFVRAAPGALSLMSRAASAAAASTSAPLVKTARLATYSLTCPPEASIHPCTCIYHTPGLLTDSDESEEEVYEISSAITTPFAERFVMTTSSPRSSSTQSPTTVAQTSPTSTATPSTSVTPEASTGSPSTANLVASTKLDGNNKLNISSEAHQLSSVETKLDTTTISSSTSTTARPISTESPTTPLIINMTQLGSSFSSVADVLDASSSQSIQYLTTSAPSGSSIGEQTSTTTSTPTVSSTIDRQQTSDSNSTSVTSRPISNVGSDRSPSDAFASSTAEPPVDASESTLMVGLKSSSAETVALAEATATSSLPTLTESPVTSKPTSVHDGAAQQSTTSMDPSTGSTTKPASTSTAAPSSSPTANTADSELASTFTSSVFISNSTATSSTTTTTPSSTTTSTSPSTLTSGDQAERLVVASGSSVTPAGLDVLASSPSTSTTADSSTWSSPLIMQSTTSDSITTQTRVNKTLDEHTNSPAESMSVTAARISTTYASITSTTPLASPSPTVTPTTAAVNLPSSSTTTGQPRASVEPSSDRPAPSQSSVSTQPSTESSGESSSPADRNNATVSARRFTDSPTTTMTPQTTTTASSAQHPSSRQPISSSTQSATANVSNWPTTSQPRMRPSSVTPTVSVKPSTAATNARQSRPGERPVATARAISTHRHSSTASPSVANHQSSGGGRQLLTPNSQRARMSHSANQPQTYHGSTTSTHSPNVVGQPDEPIGSQRINNARRLARFLSNDAHLSESAEQQKVEVVAYCRNIQNPQVLREAVKGFRGHQVNYFVIDSCKVPPFPNDLFVGIDVRWLEMSNSTVQFHNNFLHSRPTVAR